MNDEKLRESARVLGVKNWQTLRSVPPGAPPDPVLTEALNILNAATERTQAAGPEVKALLLSALAQAYVTMIRDYLERTADR